MFEYRTEINRWAADGYSITIITNFCPTVSEHVDVVVFDGSTMEVPPVHPGRALACSTTRPNPWPRGALPTLTRSDATRTDQISLIIEYINYLDFHHKIYVLTTLTTCMKRRDILTTTALFVSAGCLSGGNAGNNSSSNSGDNNESSSKTGTNTAITTDLTTTTGEDTSEATTETRSSRMTESTHTTSRTTDEAPNTMNPTSNTPTIHRTDTPRNSKAHVAFKNGGSRIVVSGTIVGKNGCQTAVLDSVRNTQSGLVITIATKRDAPETAGCMGALVDIEYRFVVRVDTPPESVTVVHRGVGDKQTITTVNRN